MAPVARSTVPVIGPSYSLTRHVPAPRTKRGSGGPKVGFSVPGPVGDETAHSGFVLGSHPDRHRRRVDEPTIGKLCAKPAQPLSRSVPAAAATSRSSRGPPAALAGQARSEEHTSELQSLRHLVCRLLLE